MAVRNFWIDADIDGRVTELCGGPKSKEGGMNVTLYQRDRVAITVALSITCEEENGKLFTRVCDKHGHMIFEHETER